MQAAIYLRISADPQGKEAGVDRQEADCRALCERLGYTVGHVFRDNDVSASVNSRERRPKYDEMLERCRLGEFAVIVAYSTSRLTRRLREFLDLIQLFDDHGTIIKTCRSGDDDLSTSRGRMVAQIKASVDEEQAATTSELARRAKKAKKDKGLYAGGARRFGFGQPLWIEKDGKRILSATDTETVNEPEAELIRKGAALLATKGVREVVRVWNASGITGVRGGAFDRDRVKQILTDPGNVPAILTGETFAQVKALMSERSVSYKRGSAPVHFLAGIARCGLCNRTMISSAKRGTVSYKCPDFHMNLQAAAAEAVVSTCVTAWYFSGRRDPGTDDRGDRRTIEQVQSERAALITERSEIQADINDGLLTRDGMRPRLTEIRDALALLDAELEQLRQTDAHQALTEAAVSETEAILTAGVPESSLDGPAPFSRAVKIRQSWDNLSVKRKKELLAANFRVIIQPSSVAGYGRKRVKVYRNATDLTASDET